MLIKLGAAISVMTQYIQRRGDTYQFCMRVPAHLHKHYGKERIRQSLNTKDELKAVREAEKLARKYQAEFKVLTDGAKATPAETALAGKGLAEQYDLDMFIDHVLDPLRAAYAQGDDHIYDIAAPSDYLSPQQLEAWKTLANANATKLSNAFELYLKTHQRGQEKAFIEKQQRDWNSLIAIVGDIEFNELSRVHARCLVSCDHVPRRSWPLFRYAGRLDCWVQQSRHSIEPGAVGSMSSRIHPQARTTPKIRQEIKDSGLSSREAAKVFNITRATAQKWLGRDDVQDRSHRAHTLHTTLNQAQEAIVMALRQSLYLPLDDLLFITKQYINPPSRARVLRAC